MFRCFVAVIGVMCFFWGCISAPDFEFVSAGVDEELETVPVPPTIKGLHAQKSNIAFLHIHYSEGLTRYHRVLSHAQTR